MPHRFEIPDLISRTIPLDCTNLPNGRLCEADGSCWIAIQDCGSQRGYYWSPQNDIARAKKEPAGEMQEYTGPIGRLKNNPGIISHA